MWSLLSMMWQHRIAKKRVYRSWGMLHMEHLSTRRCHSENSEGFFMYEKLLFSVNLANYINSIAFLLAFVMSFQHSTSKQKTEVGPHIQGRDWDKHKNSNFTKVSSRNFLCNGCSLLVGEAMSLLHLDTIPKRSVHWSVQGIKKVSKCKCWILAFGPCFAQRFCCGSETNIAFK